MAKKRTDTTLKLPDDLLGTVQAFLSFPVPPKKRANGRKRHTVKPKVTK